MTPLSFILLPYALYQIINAFDFLVKRTRENQTSPLCKSKTQIYTKLQLQVFFFPLEKKLVTTNKEHCFKACHTLRFSNDRHKFSYTTLSLCCAQQLSVNEWSHLCVAISMKCFVSHDPVSCGSGSVNRQTNKHTEVIPGMQNLIVSLPG